MFSIPNISMDNIGDSTGYDSVSGESGKSYAA
jgi:hypothetical protein